MAKLRRIQTEYVDRGFGFPIILRNVPMRRVRSRWTPEIDYNVLAKETLEELSLMKSRLTGNQVRFIRLYFELTLQEFADRFGLTHPAIIKWEKTRNSVTGMSWSTEKDIRLFVQKELKRSAKDFFEAYRYLEQVPSNRVTRLRLNGSKMVA